MLYGLAVLNTESTACYESGYFSGGADYSGFILGAIKKINLILRPQIIPIIESLKEKDMQLQSAIGNYYGDIYETHLRWAQESRLNKTPDAIPDGYMEYIMPILKAKL